MARLGLCSASVSALLFAGVASPAFAQTAPPPARPPATQSTVDDRNQDIIVTAQRRSESINTVPLSVQAVTGVTLSDLKIKTVQSLASAVPGLQVAPAYSGVPIFTLRGIGFNTTNITATATVGIYQDELSYPFPSMAVGPIFDLQRVEILKGPQGTLYGRNTTAGLIDFITNKPGQVLGAGGTVELGNYDTYNFEGYVNLPVSDTTALRVAFRDENSDKGWQRDQSTGTRLGKVDRWGARAALSFKPVDAFEAYFSVSGWKDRSDTQAGQAISLNETNRLNPVIAAFNAPGLTQYLATFQPNDAEDAGFESDAARAQQVGLAPGLGHPRADSNFISGQGKLIWKPNPSLSIISLTGYSVLNRDDTIDFSGAPYEIVSTRFDAQIRSFSQEVRAEGKGPGFSWSIGGYYGHDRLRENSVFPINQNSSVNYLRFGSLQILANPVLNAIFNTPGYTAADVVVSFREGRGVASGDATTMSGFANGEFELTRGLKLSGGVRVGIDHNELNGCSADLNGNYLAVTNLAARAIIFQTYGVLTPLLGKDQCTSYDPVTNTSVLVHSTLDQDNFSGRIALDYEVQPGTLLYASVARGVKSGVVPIVPASRATQFTPAGQEKLTAYEAGIKTQIAGRFAHLNLAGFYYDYTDKQFSSYVPDPIFGALQRVLNIPKSRAWGVDAELVLRPLSVLTFNVNATYLNTRLGQYIGTDAAGLSRDYTGARFSFAPAFSTSGTGNLNVPISSRFNFQTTLNATYQTRSHADFGEDPLFRIKGYALANGSIGIARSDGSYALTLWARNMFDHYYWTSVVDNQNLNVRFAGRPRTFGASFTANF